MEWNELSAVLDIPIAFHRIFATVGGSAQAGLFLSQAYYWTRVQDRTNPKADGWFYKTQADWKKETALTRYEQETARRELKKRGLLEEKRQGVPAQLYYRICKDALLTAISKAVHMEAFEAVTSEIAQDAGQNAADQHSSMRHTGKQVSGRVANKLAAHQQTLAGTENTSKRKQKNDIEKIYINASMEDKIAIEQQAALLHSEGKGTLEQCRREAIRWRLKV